MEFYAAFAERPAGALFRRLSGVRARLNPVFVCVAELTGFIRAKGRTVNYRRAALGNTGD
jgi:hypothetical protein